MKKIFLFAFLFLNLSIVQADPMQDLYIEIMPEKLRLDYPSETYKSFKVHLLDTYKKFPKFASILNQDLAPVIGVKTVTGKMTYVSIFPKTYKYDLSFENGEFIFKVRINLKKPTASDFVYFTDMVKQAEQQWNAYRIGMDFSYRFQFDIESDVKKAHYSVNVLDSTRGPYDVNWSRQWDGPSVAHEIGHMMGLGDEYQTLTSKTDCLPESLMCDSDGDIMKHHYYFILRRLLK
jgi:hypothetical protein